MMIKRIIHTGGILLLLILPAIVLAQGVPTGAPTTLQALYTAVCTIANWFFAFILLLSILAFIFSGYLFLTSKGGEKVEQGKKSLMYAIIGTIVVVLSKTIVVVIGDLLGVNIAGFVACG